jgi:fatty-acyl-CoA synthase
MTKSPYDTDLNRRAAHFQPLTPLTFLERSAVVFPEQLAIIHGDQRWTYSAFYDRARALASALAKRGITRGDTVSVLPAKTPGDAGGTLRSTDDRGCSSR